MVSITYSNGNPHIYQELSFEHHGWMSRQYSAFGEVFEEAVRLGLPAIQTQHPGIYFERAAHHARLRKESANKYVNQILLLLLQCFSLFLRFSAALNVRRFVATYFTRLVAICDF